METGFQNLYFLHELFISLFRIALHILFQKSINYIQQRIQYNVGTSILFPKQLAFIFLFDYIMAKLTFPSFSTKLAYPVQRIILGRENTLIRILEDKSS